MQVVHAPSQAHENKVAMGDRIVSINGAPIAHGTPKGGIVSTILDTPRPVLIVFDAKVARPGLKKKPKASKAAHSKKPTEPAAGATRARTARNKPGAESWQNVASRSATGAKKRAAGSSGARGRPVGGAAGAKAAPATRRRSKSPPRRDATGKSSASRSRSRSPAPATAARRRPGGSKAAGSKARGASRTPPPEPETAAVAALADAAVVKATFDTGPLGLKLSDETIDGEKRVVVQVDASGQGHHQGVQTGDVLLDVGTAEVAPGTTWLAVLPVIQAAGRPLSMRFVRRKDYAPPPTEEALEYKPRAEGHHNESVLGQADVDPATLLAEVDEMLAAFEDGNDPGPRSPGGAPKKQPARRPKTRPSKPRPRPSRPTRPGAKPPRTPAAPKGKAGRSPDAPLKPPTPASPRPPEGVELFAGEEKEKAAGDADEWA